MSSIIDGTGTGNRLKVAPNNRAQVGALTRTEFEDAANRGDAFNINTEEITITGAGEHALLYVKNNEDRNLEVVGWFIGQGTTTGATDSTFAYRVVGNPTGGTLISDASAITVANRNLGSSRTFDVTAYKASGSSKTITGEDSPDLLYQYHTGGRAFGTITLSLPKGSSAAVVADFNSANTVLYTGFTGYIRSSDEG